LLNEHLFFVLIKASDTAFIEKKYEEILYLYSTWQCKELDTEIENIYEKLEAVNE